ncbi:MAG: nucleotidyl transferase AbiEii/AbiGii toxin family protein [Thermodesulfobacteriota bacterium]|nr:nucleotidyl transferase AbiEii/AbiGii toxin family protein [Thermodesulfobacteriota bacterium]
MFFRCITQDMAAILNSSIFDLLPKDAYLAGGTAVALYFGHRLSVDFDLFTHQGFNSLDVSAAVSEKLGPNFNITKNRITENTLVISLDKTVFSLFTYQYPLLDKPVVIKDIPVPVASQLDLSLMKLIAILQRGNCKDFIDLKALIVQNNYTFKDLAEKLYCKYKIGSEMHLQLKKALVYFDDAEKDLNISLYSESKKIFETLKKDDWDTVKIFLRNFVR